MPLTRAVALMLCVITLLLPLGVGAAPAGPGWHQSAPPALTLETAPRVPSVAQHAPSIGRHALAADPLTTSSLASASSGTVVDAITPEIQALATGLQHDPVQIYTYVKNHITYEHYYGAKKGAQLTLFEGRGNDFDQCALLVALLRAAGLSPQYRYGLQGVVYHDTNGNDLVQWLGLSPTALAHLSWSQALAQYNVAADPWPAIADQQRKKNHLGVALFRRRSLDDLQVRSPPGTLRVIRLRGRA